MPAPFQLLASHAALDFVNTLDNRFTAAGPVELLPAYGDLLDFLEQNQLLTRRQAQRLRHPADSAAADRALQRAQALREMLASVFYAIAAKQVPSSDSLQSLTRMVVEAQAHRELVRQHGNCGEDSMPLVRWSWTLQSSLEFPVWIMAQCAADLLTSEAMPHVHACSSQTCRWLFLDTSRNHSRRWCDMALCGNRMKARRFQARRPR